MNFIMTMIFILPIIVCFFLYHQILDLRTKRIIEKNSYKKMMDLEVAQKRIYYNLSEKLIYEKREWKHREKVLLLKNTRLFRLLRAKNKKTT